MDLSESSFEAGEKKPSLETGDPSSQSNVLELHLRQLKLRDTH